MVAFAVYKLLMRAACMALGASPRVLFPPMRLPRVVLGSQSSIRRALLQELATRHGFSYTLCAADIDEKAIRHEQPEKLVTALAHAKAAALLPTLTPQAGDAPTLLITCDQVVAHKGRILEKPESREQARDFISGYADSPACTVGAVLCTNVQTGYTCEGVDVAEVHFRAMPEEVLERLLDDEITYRVAGGLCVEHELVTPLVERLVGSMDAVQGLPQSLVESLLHQAYYSGNMPPPDDA